VPERNRVTPYGQIIVSPLRGSWMGNRGCIHRGREIVRRWNSKHWIACALEFKGWVAPKWVPNRWTALFFYDEALVFAAGHRPCALCRRSDYRRYKASVGLATAEEIDTRLHAERLNGREKRTHVMPWREVPVGAYAELDGVAHVVLEESLRPWSDTRGYGDERVRPSSRDAVILTPPLSIRAIVAGYQPQIRDRSYGRSLR
jgi:hypothetical protein